VNIRLPNGAQYHLRAGDVIRYIDRSGPEPCERTGAVLRYLTFPSHVVVGGRWCGCAVTPRDFVRLVRRGRGPEMPEAFERIL
jgi:hypothetical protein